VGAGVERGSGKVGETGLPLLRHAIRRGNLCDVRGCCWGCHLSAALRRWCSWCNSDLDGLGPLKNGEDRTDGVCGPCRAEFEREADALLGRIRTPLPSREQAKPSAGRFVQIEDALSFLAFGLIWAAALAWLSFVL
jgi:hypothetical protein